VIEALRMHAVFIHTIRGWNQVYNENSFITGLALLHLNSCRYFTFFSIYPTTMDAVAVYDILSRRNPKHETRNI
jgi:hypothetical protein